MEGKGYISGGGKGERKRCDKGRKVKRERIPEGKGDKPTREEILGGGEGK